MAEQPKGVIHIIQSQDPSETPKIVMEGTWTHVQMNALPLHLMKAFRAYMANLKRELKENSE